MYSIKTKKIWIILIVCISLLVVCISFFPRSKKAIHIDELDKIENNYILVQVQYSTSALWKIVGDNSGYYEKPFDIELQGVIPKVNYDIQTGNNTFVCYGHYIENIIKQSGYETMAFEVIEWDILYPIQHNNLLSPLLSKSYLYAMEILDKD